MHVCSSKIWLRNKNKNNGSFISWCNSHFFKKKGIEGLKLLNKNPPFIYKNKKNFIEMIKLVLSNHKKIKKIKSR